MRLFRGNPPQGAEWVKVGDWTSKEGERWVVWARCQAHNPDWITYKVCAYDPVPNKGNYWFAKNQRTRATGFARDLMHMEQHRPALLAALKEML